jgi:VWFA-related protein
MLGPQDLFGFLTSRNSVKDLVLGRKSTVIQSQIADMFRSANIDRDDADQLDGCMNGESLKGRHRADQTYSVLEGLVTQLGEIRQERKNVVFVSNLLPRWGPLGNRGSMLPKAGITQGRVGIGDRTNAGGSNDSYCAAELQRLATMDFDERFRQLLRDARRDNVSFYNVTPAGLQVPATVGGMRAVQNATDSLISLASETDGMAIVNTNDLRGGMKRIAADLAAYYVLGYYTTNTKFDGRVRDIKVRLKSSGKAVRARRQYRAPTEAEIAALSAPSRTIGAAGTSASPSPLQVALAVLDAAAPTRKADVPAGALIGEPSVFRVAPRMPPQRAGVLHFDRADGIRIDWPMLGATDRRELRLLDRAGRPLPVNLPLREDPATRGLSLAFPLAAFSRADYIVELTVTAGPITERRLLALRVK